MVSVFDEMNGMDGRLRPPYLELSRWLAETPPHALDHRQREAELLFRRIGITFAVYGDADAQERREIMLRLFPELFARHRIAPVENYPNELLTTLKTAPASHAKNLPNSFVGYRNPRYVTSARPIAPCCATTRFGFHGSA